MARRIEERIRSQTPAQIVRFDLTMECLIRDLSARGARLKVADPGKVPNEFELVERPSGRRRPAHVRWRRDTEVGISFFSDRRAFGRREQPPVRGDG